MKAFLQPWEDLEEIRRLREQLKKNKGVAALNGSIDAAKAHMIWGIGYDVRTKLIVVQDEKRGRQLTEELGFFEDTVLYYPAKDLLFYQSDVRGNALTRERLRVVEALRGDGQVTVVTTFPALMNRVIPVESYIRNILTLAPEQEIPVETLRKALAGLGYETVSQVEHPGEFAVRGGIVDVFPLTEEYPVRIEFWGDEIDTIRRFDPVAQTSLHGENTVESLSIYPAAELVLSPDEIEKGLAAIEKDASALEEKYRKAFHTEEAHRIRIQTDQMTEEIREGLMGQEAESHLTYFCPDTQSLVDYFPDDSLLVLDEVRRLKEQADASEQEFNASMEHRLEGGYILPGQMQMMWSTDEVFHKISKHTCLTLSTLDTRDKTLKADAYYHVRLTQGSPYNGSYEMFLKDLNRLHRNRQRVVYAGASRTRAKHLAQDLQRDGVNAYYSDDTDHVPSPGEVMLTGAPIARGYAIPDASCVIITEQDVFGTRSVKPKRRKKAQSGGGEVIRSFEDLHPGDYVVHENHGLGIYRGMERIEVNHVMKDYIRIEYAKGGTLYILASQLDMLQKYAGSDAKKPKLNTLGGKEWTETRSRVKHAVGNIARELVELYADRQNRKGYVYGPDTVWQREFEEAFPYEETEGQKEAIAAVKQDMESPKIMDRLICGDVGYGKTEIAMRAAFKAVQEGKQVAVLVPTTILAQQHYDTFTQRMSGYPVNIGLLCRFRTEAQQKETIEGLKKGSIDIVIGTHRLLSKDVKYKDLGLLVIDEEQRFGVAHKEKIKQIRRDVDVLSMTATPIPRTLHMSLIGIRDMSLLEDAPTDRMPIQTFVFEYNPEMVREAILRELSRGGQVYYVFNRISSIADMAAKIHELVPEANVGYAHGRMSQSRLEEVMFDFVNGDIDVLVSTTIIEIGMDISNVNTIIIHDADTMGLSQLYQLRGRVGRSGRTAYAFFMYRKDKMLKEVAEKRLAAIKEFSDLGSGFKIAMRDLEIRGAGNMLGAEQSGHMAAVGYDLYCKMLNEAVRREKGEKVEDDFETTVDLSMDAYIPDRYIPDDTQRLDIYKRIADISDGDARDAMIDELIDRFGEPPKAVQNLLWISLFRAKAHKAYITDIKQKGNTVEMSLYQKAQLDPAAIPQIVTKYQPYVTFAANTDTPGFIFDFGKNSKISARDLPEYLDTFVQNLYTMAALDAENPAS